MSENKRAYLAGGVVIGALAAAYYMKRLEKCAIEKGEYFSQEYSSEAGISKSLSSCLGNAFKGAIDYDLRLWIQPEKKRFNGIAELTFILDPEYKENIYLSVHNFNIHQIKINGCDIDAAHMDEICESQKGYLLIANKHIISEKFKILIKYSGEFGSVYGLIHYQDSRLESGDSYIFSSTNIIGASTIYPVIESPEVRCLFKLSLAVPTKWKAISNEKSSSPAQIKDEFGKLGYGEEDACKDDYHIYTFDQTKAIPFNALNIAAGKFAEFKTHTNVHGNAVNLYCVRSEKMKIENIIEHIGNIVKISVSKMEKLTNIEYPYTQCDILVLPEDLIFPAIFALNPIKLNREYPGLTTIYLRDYHNFTVEFVYEAVTSLVRLWFGSMISIKWWSGLWISESLSRYIALRIMKEDPQAFGVSELQLYYLDFWLKSQAIYYESQNDITFTNHSLAQDDIINSFDALFFAQNKSEKVGIFKIEELFSFYSDDVFRSVIYKLMHEFIWHSIDYDDFKACFVSETVRDARHTNKLAGCFDYAYLDEIKFSRTSVDRLTVQRITRESSDLTKYHLIDILFINKQGRLIKRKTHLLDDQPKQFDVDDEVFVFLSVMHTNGVFYELYDKDDIDKIFDVLRKNADVEPSFKLIAARILLTNTLKARSINIKQSLEHLKTLLDICTHEEQKWLIRSFSVLSKHIDRNKETSGPIRAFCSYLVGLARQNYGLVPYLGYIGCFDTVCKQEVYNFLQDYVSSVNYDPATSLLNYDLLKSSILMITFLRSDLENVILFPDLVSTHDKSTGSTLFRIVEEHIRDLATEHLKIKTDFRSKLLSRPTYDNALEYYFMSMLIRTEKSDEMTAIRMYLADVLLRPDDHIAGGKKTFIYYNIAKMMSAASRDEGGVDGKMDLTPGIDAMVARRFKHYFRLA